jgi:hypothetical protein
MSNLKKRGRKPKNKIIVNDNPEFDNANSNDIIIKINTEKNENSIDDIDIIFSIDDIIDNNIDIIDNNIDIIYNNMDNIDTTKDIDNICKNCNKINLSNNEFVPLKYINNIFYIKDKFCCEDCCKKYIFEKCIYNKYEIYSIYKLYKHNLKNNINIIIKYINTKKKVNNNIEKKLNLKLYREKKENNILNFINNV